MEKRPSEHRQLTQVELLLNQEAELVEVRDKLHVQRTATEQSLANAYEYLGETKKQFEDLVERMSIWAEQDTKTQETVIAADCNPELLNAQQELDAAVSIAIALSTEMDQIRGYLQWTQQKLQENAIETNELMNSVFAKLRQRDSSLN